MRLSHMPLPLALAALAAAQEPPATGGGGPIPPGRLSVQAWSEAESRRLFAGCDANSDDRLDLFEASAAIETLGQPREREAYRRFDRDRDGYLGFPEFDLYFRETIQRGDPLRIRTCREIPAPPTAARRPPRSPAQQMLDLFDTDGSGDLKGAEIDGLVNGIGLPPTFTALVRSLDKDRSGGIGESELASALQALPAGLPTGSGANALLGPANKAQTLPPPWGEIDINRNASVEVHELAVALRQIDAELARWAPQILQAADRNRDGRLDTTELLPTVPGSSKAEGQTMVEPRSRG